MLPSMILAGTVQVPLSKDVMDIPVQLPVRIQFVQDVSTSMRGIKLLSSKEGLQRICRKLSQSDEVGLIKFGNIVEVVSFHTLAVTLIDQEELLWTHVNLAKVRELPVKPFYCSTYIVKPPVVAPASLTGRHEPDPSVTCKSVLEALQSIDQRQTITVIT
ncbi:hypothetical protein BC938DRAFT_472301, partial [Jimgerdemannia flammicorona]